METVAGCSRYYAVTLVLSTLKAYKGFWTFSVVVMQTGGQKTLLECGKNALVTHF